MNYTDNLNLKTMGPSANQWTSIGLGTWNMEKHPKAAIEALRVGIEQGANHIDTAEMYGDGKAEEIVGEAIAGQRSKIYLVSKVLPSNASYDGTIAACERSLKRLKTDHLDIYLLHWRQRRTELSETFRAFEKLKADGKIRAWGVSNFDVADLEQAVELVGEGKIACNQVLYHLRERAIESKLIGWCHSHDISVVAYSPLGGESRPTSHATLDQIAQAHQATASQIALAFLTKDPAVFAIPKSANSKRARENVSAMNIVLTPEQIQSIDRAFPLVPKHELPML